MGHDKKTHLMGADGDHRWNLKTKLPVTIHFWSLMFWYPALAFLPGLREPSTDILIPAFLGKAYKQRSKPF